MSAKVTIEGLDKVINDLKRIGGTPKKYVAGAAKKAMTPVLKRAKAAAPEKTGMLKKGMKLTPEKGPAGKKVYRLVFDREYNSVFQKTNKEGKPTGYYPVSQEYGWLTKGEKRIPGKGFVHDSFDVAEIERIIVEEMKSRIDNEIKKAGLD